ncbi:hypothetical protein BRL54_08030 [Corynebacterium ulcerans]|nr:hypothetical protein BRL54_08030 [Corynebacterium ulcerans]
MLNRRLVLDYNDYRLKKQELYIKERTRLGAPVPSPTWPRRFPSRMIMKNNIHLVILGLLVASVTLGAPRVITYGLAALLFAVLTVKTWSLARAWAKQ